MMKSKPLHLLGLAMLLLLQQGFSQTPINPLFFGQSYWYTNNGDNSTTNDDFTSPVWSAVLSSGVRLMRVGGNGYNTGSNKPTNPQGYVTMVDNIRNNGCEPMITVPFSAWTGNELAPQAEYAAEIVRVINIVHKRNVKYFIIANEPGFDQEQPFGSGNFHYYNPGNVSGTFNATTDGKAISNYIKEFAVAMKKIDPSIKIIGPELEWGYTQILDELFSDPALNSNSVKGMIPPELVNNVPNLAYVDFLSYHLYPSTTSMDTRTEIISNPQNHEAKLDEVYLKYIKGCHPNFSQAGFDRTTGPAPLKIAITEMNVTPDKLTKYEQSVTLNALNGTTDLNNTISFISGQWLAEMMAMMMEKSPITNMPASCSPTPSSFQYSNSTNTVEFINLWSVKEGYDPSANPIEYDHLGYLHGTTGEKKPIYWHYQIVANHFRGQIYKNKNTSAPTGAKAYACKSANNIAVLLMNQADNSLNSDGNFTYRINFNGSIPSGSEFNIAFDMGFSSLNNFTPSSSNYIDLNNESTYLLVFNCSTGALAERYEIKKSDMVTALNSSNYAGYSPSHTTFSALPALTIMANANTECLLDNTTLLQTTSSTVTANNIGGTYSWAGPNGYTASGTSATGITVPGTYTVTVTGTCGTSQAVAVVHKKSPIGDAGDDKLVCYPGTSSIGTSSSQGTYSWSPSNYISSTTVSSPTFTSPSAGLNTYTYTATVTGNGCKIKDEVLVTVPANQYDLYMEDLPNDGGLEVDHGPVHMSSDIWIQNHAPVSTQTANHSNTPLPITQRYLEEHYHEQPREGSNPWVYAKIRNRGCSVLDGTVTLHYVRSSVSGDAWATCSGNICGDWTIIGQGSVKVAPGDVETIAVEWTDVTQQPLPAESTDYCILARFVATTPSNDPENLTATPQHTRLVENNNWIQKNVKIVNASGFYVFHDIRFTNFSSSSVTGRIDFEIPNTENNTNLLANGDVYINLGPTLYSQWQAGGGISSGIQTINDSIIEVVDTGAYISGIRLYGNDDFDIGFKYSLNTQPNPLEEYTFNMYGKIHNGTTYETKGGEHYIIRPSDCPGVYAGSDKAMGRGTDGPCSTDLNALPYISGATYIWYDAVADTVIDTAQTATVAILGQTMTYAVKMISSGCDTVTDTLTVTYDSNLACARLAQLQNSQQGTLLDIVPNPASDKATVLYTLEEGVTDAEVVIVNVYGQLIARHKVNPGADRFELDCRDLASGIYFSSLLVNGSEVSTMKMIITK